jgi:hypothetical protein
MSAACANQASDRLQLLEIMLFCAMAQEMLTTVAALFLYSPNNPRGIPI